MEHRLMGGIMSYRRLRERNRLQREVPLPADPYSESIDRIASTYTNTGMLLGDWNRFERDVLGYSCWCGKHTCCDHDSDEHNTEFIVEGKPYKRLTSCNSCECKQWDSRPLHKDGSICPDNTYAGRIAEHVNKSRTSGPVLSAGDIRYVLRAFMEVQ
jgi:hypothetical protein